MILLSKSYDEWRRHRTCTRKTRYTQVQATRVARAMWETNPSVRAYHCAYCGHWHVGRTRGFEERDPNEWKRPKGGDSGQAQQEGKEKG